MLSLWKSYSLKIYLWPFIAALFQNFMYTLFVSAASRFLSLKVFRIDALNITYTYWKTWEIFFPKTFLMPGNVSEKPIELIVHMAARIFLFGIKIKTQLKNSMIEIIDLFILVWVLLPNKLVNSFEFEYIGGSIPLPFDLKFALVNKLLICLVFVIYSNDWLV